MSTSPRFAFVTLITSDAYLPGALVVAAALKDIHVSPPVYPDELDTSEFDRVCLVTPETVDVSTVKLLRRVFDVVVGVEVIEDDNEEGLSLLGRLDLKTVLTKLHVFRLTSYSKIIFLDADVLPLRPISHLFHLTSSFAAVPDVGWPDIFNSGFLVLEPSEDKFKNVMELVRSKGSWDGGDQGVLNEWVGQDWERLSFTYNTTPTAVYTYAPAYKRFGSQIRNIHFIGPNKPWLQIPFRSPDSSSSTTPPTTLPSQEFTPSPSYGFPALLDRWFAVYDKRYRSPTTPAVFQNVHSTLSGAAEEVTVQRYESAWNTDVRPDLGAEVSASAPLGLEELRRMAVEGTGQSGTGDTEAVYRSLPLDGRVDLMRPPNPQPVVKQMLPRAVRILLPEDCHTPLRPHSPMATLPTPGPNEFPPTPVFRGQSLPPETPTHARPEGFSYITPDHDLRQHLATSSSSQPSTPTRPLSPMRQASPRHTSPPRRASPPLLVWNPAVEAPPNDPPPVSHFREKAYFPNVWDAPQEQYSVDDNSGLFPLPPPSRIPEMLIREGHYKAVIGEPSDEGQQQHTNETNQHLFVEQYQQQSEGQQQHHLEQEHLYHPEEQFQDHSSEQTQHHHSEIQSAQSPLPHEHHSTHQPSHPHPDRSKVVAVFPWEETPRHAPNRFFPRTDSPPPGHPFIQPQSPALKLDACLPPTHVSPPATSPPQHGFPRTTMYANAWDAVPSIQRYAARLVRPAPAPISTELVSGSGRTRKGSAATAGGDGYPNWQDAVEVSSRDADDEDEGDDDDEPSPPIGEAAPAPNKGPEDRPPFTRKLYRGMGVQTMPRDVRHQAVQVQNGNGKPHTRFGPRYTGQRERVTQNHNSSEDDQPHPPGPTSDPMASSIGRKGARRIPAAASALEAPSASAVPELSPAGGVRAASGAGAAAAAEQTASPPSSLGPTSPPEGVPVSPETVPTATPMSRPVGRSFDPARSVDVFKKGSEEVLARFLKMSSWEDDSPMGTGPQGV